MLAHLAWQLRNQRTAAATAQALIDQFEMMDTSSKSWLLGATLEINSYPFPELSLYRPGRSIDLNLMIEAALRADQQIAGRGDYRNRGLHEAVATLLALYELSCGDLPSLNRKPTGPHGQGSFRTVADSPAAPFLFEFFKRVEPELPATAISTALERRLAEVRRRRAGDEPNFGLEGYEHWDERPLAFFAGSYMYPLPKDDRAENQPTARERDAAAYMANLMECGS